MSFKWEDTCFPACSLVKLSGGPCMWKSPSCAKKKPLWLDPLLFKYTAVPIYASPRLLSELAWKAQYNFQ